MIEYKLLKDLNITQYSIHASLWKPEDEGVHVHYKMSIGFTSAEMSFKVKSIKDVKPELIRRAKAFNEFHKSMPYDNGL